MALLLLLAAPSDAVLRNNRPADRPAMDALPEEAEEFAPEGPTGSLRYLNLGERERQKYEDGLVREYSANLSHSRACWSMQAAVSFMRPLILPELKVAFCYVPKAACTQFKDLFNAMNKVPFARPGFGVDYLLSSAEGLNYDPRRITRENGWKFAFFTRDPALRYLSAFGSTCVADTGSRTFEHAYECCGPLIPDNTISASRMIKLFQRRVFSDLKLGNVHEDDHWSSQTHILRHCGEHFNPRLVDYHGDVSHGEMNAQVKEMLSLNGPIDDHTKYLVDRFFPRQHIAGHQSPLRHIPPELFYNNASTLEAIRQLYSEDYQVIPKVGQGFTDVQLAKTGKQRRTERAEMIREVEMERRQMLEGSAAERKHRDKARSSACVDAEGQHVGTP